MSMPLTGLRRSISPPQPISDCRWQTNQVTRLHLPLLWVGTNYLPLLHAIRGWYASGSVERRDDINCYASDFRLASYFQIKRNRLTSYLAAVDTSMSTPGLFSEAPSPSKRRTETRNTGKVKLQLNPTDESTSLNYNFQTKLTEKLISTNVWR
jgi:hypothetical protein